MKTQAGKPKRSIEESILYLRTLPTPELVKCAKENIGSTIVIPVVLDRLMDTTKVVYIKDAAIKRLTAENDALRLRLLEAGLSYE